MDNLSYCKFHTDQYLQFLCLDQTCNKSSKVCVFCIKNQHEDCDERYIININQIQDKVVIKKSDDISNIEKEVSKRIENEFDKFFNYLEDEKNYILEGFQSPNNNMNNLTVQEIQKYKQFFDISKNTKNKKVVIQSKINPKQENIEEDIEYFKAKLQNKMDVGSKLLKEMTFYNTQELQEDVFEDIECNIQKKYNGIEIKREQHKRSIIYTRKPVRNFKLKLTGKRTEKFSIFLATQRYLKKVKKQRSLYQDKDIIGVRGYGAAQNMDGHKNFEYNFDEQYKMQTDMNSDDIFGNSNVKDDFIDYELYVEYNKDEGTFRMYTRDKKVDLKKEKMTDTKYYLIMELLQDGQKILIESHNNQ